MRFAPEIAFASREIARIRSDIVYADSTAISPLSPIHERAASMRAYAYVWLAAVLERIVRDAVQSTLREISALTPAHKDLRLSLFALICEGDFDSVSSRARSNAWEVKINLLSRTADPNPAALSEHILPLDGRTIRAEHFDIIWLVLGLPSPSTPTALHRVALKDLADGRNEVAHGNTDPVAFGRKKATRDLLRLTSRVEDLVAHLLAGLDDYIGRRLFAR